MGAGTAHWICKFCYKSLRLRNDLYCVEWGVKLYSHSLTHIGHIHTSSGHWRWWCLCSVPTRPYRRVWHRWPRPPAEQGSSWTAARVHLTSQAVNALDWPTVASWWFHDTVAARLVVGLSPLRVRWNGTHFQAHSRTLLGVSTASDWLWKLLFAAQRNN